jgi:monoamine oxidase
MHPTRRDIFKLAGVFAGSAAMYRTMSALGALGKSDYRGRAALTGQVRNASVIILGAGMAGLTAAWELSKLGYRVEVLEYNERPGGRSWTIRGGDVYTEMGGESQTCEFATGQYFNPGPLRISYEHHAFLDYCRQFGIALEAFAQLNANAYLHSTAVFGGRPQRFGAVQSDFEGYVAEMLAKVAHQRALDESLSKEDLEVLLEALRSWGALDSRYRYRTGDASAARRGYTSEPSAGLSPSPLPTRPLGLSDLLKSNFWVRMAEQHDFQWQPTLLQPVGGMDMLAKAMARRLAPAVKYGAKVTEIRQDADGVTVAYRDGRAGEAIRHARADWCVCTIPISILEQIPMNVGQEMIRAMSALYYNSAVKVALQFKRRFWEQDEGIYGGISFTDLPINQILYPSNDLGSAGKGVVVGAYVASVPNFRATTSFEVSGLSPKERIAWALKEGAKLHPQYFNEFENGFAVAWHRVPGNLGCFALWRDDVDASAYHKNLCAVDGRIVLAGEHTANSLPGWQEGAILSSLDAIGRLHKLAFAQDARKDS